MGIFTNLFGKSPRVAIIESFAENPKIELTTPEIVIISGISRRSVYNHIIRLEKEGIIRKTKKVGKCNYYKFNENDPRGSAITYLESVLVLGSIEKEIKIDYDIPLDKPFPFEIEYKGKMPRKNRVKDKIQFKKGELILDTISLNAPSGKPNFGVPLPGNVGFDSAATEAISK